MKWLVKNYLVIFCVMCKLRAKEMKMTYPKIMSEEVFLSDDHAQFSDDPFPKVIPEGEGNDTPRFFQDVFSAMDMFNDTNSVSILLLFNMYYRYVFIYLRYKGDSRRCERSRNFTIEYVK